MLVLTRRKNEEVIITVPGCDDQIIISVLNSNRGEARLGFTAPTSITINRSEVEQRSKRNSGMRL